MRDLTLLQEFGRKTTSCPEFSQDRLSGLGLLLSLEFLQFSVKGVPERLNQKFLAFDWHSVGSNGFSNIKNQELSFLFEVVTFHAHLWIPPFVIDPSRTHRSTATIL